jgi:hypothetical protein
MQATAKRTLLTAGWQQARAKKAAIADQLKGLIMPLKGSCHCGNTQFEVTEAPAGVTRCTCSLCLKRGALWAYYTPAQFRLTSPEENVATYQWRTKTVKHNFCARRFRSRHGGDHRDRR